MNDNNDDIVAVLRSGIEKRLQEQISRHQKVDPTTDVGKIVDIQIKQENEKLERLARDYEGKGQDEIAELVDDLASEILPMIARSLKGH